MDCRLRRPWRGSRPRDRLPDIAIQTWFVARVRFTVSGGAETELTLSQAVASSDAFERRPSECGHCVQNFLADLDLRDLSGEAAGLESGADDALPTADLRFYPAALVVTCCRMLGHAAIAADLGNMAGAVGNAGGGRCSGVRTTAEASAACQFRFEGESWRRSPWPPR